MIWTDISLTTTLAFVYGFEGFISQLKPPPANIKINIFFLELIAIFSAIYHVATNLSTPPCCLLLFTDSLDSIGVLNSLSASQSMHNSVLLRITEVILRSHIDLHIRLGNSKGIPMGITMSTPTLTLEGNTLHTHG